MKTLNSSKWRRDYLVAYIAFGILHELSHLATATLLGYEGCTDLFGFILGRTCSIPSLETAEDWEIDLIRHSGWVASVIIALVLVIGSIYHGDAFYWNNLHFSSLLWASMMTALEGISTDLINVNTPTFANMTTFLCGNFGVILLNPGWTNTPGDYGKTALDLLEKMTEITMMRGAQTGGVVAWTSSNGKAVNSKDLSPIRVRVVNGKRTDLSELLRKQLNRQLCSGRKINPSIRCLMGHTRFATSSKATIDGTHPHQWSPAERYSIYPLDDVKVWLSLAPKPVVQNVSNYITHNGDLDFFKVNDVLADLEAVQRWLEMATGYPMPAPVDSAAIAGLVDLIRCAGCFSLSIRFAHVLASNTASVATTVPFPSLGDYSKLGKIFEMWLPQFCSTNNVNLKMMKNDESVRVSFAKFMMSKILSDFDLVHSAFTEYSLNDEKDIEQPNDEIAVTNHSLRGLVANTVEAFFDNDLFFTTKYFLKNAVGSFGLMVTSSMDASRQICIAARGQPMSVAFFPDKGIICYGSELAAVKAGMNYDNPSGNIAKDATSSSFKLEADMTQMTCRFDLDDLGGEVVLLDFSGKDAKVTTYQESFTSGGNIRTRITPLNKNEFLIPLTPDVDDQILDDIQTIPRALERIRNNWREGDLNRMAAWNLGRCLKRRLEEKVLGNELGSSVDILITGCEVSLYLSEQFASDLQKSFPKLKIQATSSNKLLGIFGQELAVPSIGFPLSSRIPYLKNTIVIIVSHSGGTFGPLAISNLLQSVTKDIFVVASEWDTQIGKQLRSMYSLDKDIFASRVFSTNVGVRPSEPCTLSVCATHQLLTQIYQHICLVVLNVHRFRQVSGAVVTEQDLRVLEKCNIDNTMALERITGTDLHGFPIETQVHGELKEAGKLWADHVLENARAYILSFLYIVGTVTAGYPLITGIAVAAGMRSIYGFYITRFFDSLIYFFLPQINIIFIRLVQGRNLLHRMTCRTVVIGDIPWVSQCADAFLSKIFARSYSIAGLNVLSGNPTDHLVHRHTHRVVRGSLLVCGRPDGRLTALTSAECSVNLSVNQASSIQSLGGTCESITIGHNPSKLQLTVMDIALGTHRPKFLCEQILDVVDDETARMQHALASKVNSGSDAGTKSSILRRILGGMRSLDHDDEIAKLDRSSHSLKGAYLGLREQASNRDLLGRAGSRRSFVTNAGSTGNPEMTCPSPFLATKQGRKEDGILAALIEERKHTTEARTIFNNMDINGNGTIELDEFVAAYEKAHPGMSRTEIENLFHEADVDDSGGLTYAEFEAAMSLDGAEVIRRLHHSATRNEKGMLQVLPSAEEYFGADMHMAAKPGISAFSQSHSQHFSMELYESRIASLQRFVALCVMFHQMGKRVQDFFPKYSFGMFGYKMNRTHSIMRIATTASPVSGDAVREQMEHLRVRAAFQNAVHLIVNSWRRKQENLVRELKLQHRTLSMGPSSTRTISLDDVSQTSKSKLDSEGAVSSESNDAPKQESV